MMSPKPVCVDIFHTGTFLLFDCVMLIVALTAGAKVAQSFQKLQCGWKIQGDNVLVI
jgi:hypothetical protein